MSEIDWKARADAAEAREAVLRDALQGLYDEQNGPPLIRRETDWQMAMRDAVAALYSTAEAAAARDARIRDEGRREGIEESARVADEFGLDAASAIRALLDKPAGEDGR